MEPNEGDGLDAWGVFLLGRIGKISRPSERDTFLAGFKAGRAKQPSQTSVPLFDWAMQIAAIIADEDWTREEVIWAAQKIAEFAKEQPSQTPVGYVSDQVYPGPSCTLCGAMMTVNLKGGYTQAEDKEKP